MDTVKINLSWSAFSEIKDKYPERVLTDIHAGNFHFTDSSVIFHIPANLLLREPADA